MKPARPVQTGDLVANTYRLEYVLGQGRSGIVFAARERRGTERVAIKVLLRELAQHPDAIESFRCQARAAAAVRCDEVCRVLELAETESGIPCVVMEYLEGCDLSRAAAARAPYVYSEAASYILQACAGLGAALEIGVVHADLKPSKLFALAGRDERRVKLLDLGGSVATAAVPVAAGLRQLRGGHAALWLCDAEYSAPEQLDAHGLVDARTNVWAVGAILYRLVCGRPPFHEPTPQRLMAAVRADEPASPRALDIDVPEGFTRVLERALAKSRADRFASVTELASALAPYASDGRITH